jgi:hypothetical protein
MFLFEFDENNLVSKVVALTNQLQQDLDQGKLNDGYTVDELLDYFSKYDVILDVNDLYNMIRVDPLKKLIKNIQNDKVVFVGQDEGETDTDTNDKTVEKMAKRAQK